MKKNRIFLCLLMCMVLLGNTQYVNAASGNARFLYSSDWFAGDDIFTSELAEICSDAGYSTYNVSRPTIPYGINSNLQYSDLFFISSHGDQGKLIVRMTNNTDYYYTASDVPYYLNTKLVYLSACQSALTDPVHGNLCSALIDSGVRTVIGYNNLVSYDSRYFEMKFYEIATSGYNYIAYSLARAKSEILDIFGEDNTVTNAYVLFGNPLCYIN